MPQRRSEEVRIAELESRIQQLKARMQEKKVTKDPALRFVAKAVKALDTAASGTRDVPLRESIESARATLSACLSLAGIVVSAQAGARQRRSAAVIADARGVEADVLLQYIKKNPGQRGEQISAALGTTSLAMRPTMKQLIEGGQVKVKGERRATAYSAV